MQLYVIKCQGLWYIVYLDLSITFFPDIDISEAVPVWVDSRDDHYICEFGKHDQILKLPS